MGKHILITGGLGYIGSHCIVELIKNSYTNIVIVDNNSNSDPKVLDKIHEIIPSEVKVIYHKLDLLEKDKLNEIFNLYEFDSVIHFAALKSVTESISIPILYYQNNITGTLNVLECMKEHNCKKIIFSSSATVYGEQKYPVTENCTTGHGITTPYGRTKFFIEEILKDLSISDKTWSIIALRYFNPVGAHPSGLIGEDPIGFPNNLFPHILRGVDGTVINIYGNDYNTPDGTCVRDFIHVCDLATGHVASMAKLETVGFHVFNLGTGKGVSVLELIKSFEKTNNVKLNYTFVPRRNGDLECVYANVAKAQAELHWVADKSIDDICRDGFKFYAGSTKVNPTS